MPPHLLADASLSCWNLVASLMDSSLPLKTSPLTQYPPVTASTPHTPLTSPPVPSYPAVLVGRMNQAESKPKVPPPVPPRGIPKTKRGGGIAGKGLHPVRFSHERHASAPITAFKADSLFDSESFSSSSSKKVYTLPIECNSLEKLKANFMKDAANELNVFALFKVPGRGKLFKDLVEARNEILGRNYEDIEEELSIYPTNWKRHVLYDSNLSLNKGQNSLRNNKL